MGKTRLEAFSDGVIAILITVMVLELRVPQDASWAALGQMWPVVLCYILSFINLGIYWNNHHHLLRAAKRMSGASMWANHHLLFWLSLVPFATAWMGENHFASLPVAVYGFVLFCCGVAYYVLSETLIKANGADSELARAVKGNPKELVSVVLYLVAIALAFIAPFVSGLLYLAVSITWLIPDRRIAEIDGEPAPS